MLMLTDMYHTVKKNFEVCFNDNYGGYIDEDDYSDACDALDSAVTSVRGRTFSGCTKAVFVPSDTHRMVLKVPYNVNFFYGDDEENPIVDPFRNAGNEDNGWDYCEREFTLYEDMVEKGFGMFFAETRFYGYTDNGYPLYLQEQATTFRNSDIEVTGDYKVESFNFVTTKRKEGDSRLTNEYRIFMTEWIAKAIDFYGKELVDNFLKVILKSSISEDMHLSNYGYRTTDGSPCLIDWASFYED